LAAPRGRKEAGVKDRLPKKDLLPQSLREEPWSQDFFDLLRRFERERGLAAAVAQSRPPPRIGESSSRTEEYVRLGHDPYFAFPASNVSRIDATEQGDALIFVKFLGLLGPQGALPLATTEEAYRWSLARDDAFPRFLDILNHRFLQLFFRAWSDARPIAQHDRPDLDRFLTYIGAAVGIGSRPLQNRDSISDWRKLGLAGLLGAKAKSASRLRGAIRAMFAIETDIEQFVGAHLALDPSDCGRLGAAFATLGGDAMIGASYYSVQDKFRIRLYAADLEEYLLFLPEGANSETLVDLVYFYLGDELDWDVELAIPAPKAVAMQLGGAPAGLLGWTTWLAPDPEAEGYRCDAVFHAAEHVRRKRGASPANTT
jgi:type VI secretion system protein ImpH